MRQLPLAIGHRGLATFDTFEPGDNRALLAALQAWLDRWARTRDLDHAPSRGAPPLYLWGPSGSGKTHLLTALVAAVQAAGGRAAWLHDLPGAAEPADADPSPGLLDRSLDLLLIDDSHALDAAGQQRAFAAFVEAADAGFAIVAAGRSPPVDLPVREDLRTRLGWGEIHPVRPLSEAETRAALRQEADRRGIFLGDEVMAWLLTRYQRDLRSLMALLDRLDAYALTHQRAVTLPLLRRMLEEEGRLP